MTDRIGDTAELLTRAVRRFASKTICVLHLTVALIALLLKMYIYIYILSSGVAASGFAAIAATPLAAYRSGNAAAPTKAATPLKRHEAAKPLEIRPALKRRSRWA